MSTPATVLSLGGGVNSTAALIGLVDRGEAPALVLFADTGGEKPETYAHVDQVFAWCAARGIRAERVVYASKRFATLEQSCTEQHMLPSIAYGRKACSEKWKRRPQDRFLRSWPPAVEAWKRGERVVRIIGFDFGEVGRARFIDDSKRWTYSYPLIDWRWNRAECVAAIAAAGFVVPSKSACFFCPSSRKVEVLALARSHPDLFARAVAMERGAKLQTVRGLGRHWRWEDLVRADDAQGKLFAEPDEVPCGCFDDAEQRP